MSGDENECKECIMELKLDSWSQLLEDYINLSLDRGPGYIDDRLLTLLSSFLTDNILTHTELAKSITGWLQWYTSTEMDAPNCSETVGPFIVHWLSEGVLSVGNDLLELLNHTQFQTKRKVDGLKSRGKLLGAILSAAAEEDEYASLWEEIQNQLKLPSLLQELFNEENSPWKSLEEYWADFKIQQESW